VQADEEKGEKAKHAPKTDEVRELEQFAKWRDAKGEDKKTKSPIASGVLQELDRIGAEIAPDDTPDQIAERYQANKKDGDFGPFAGEECMHAAISP
jgi:hypothetical protein